MMVAALPLCKTGLCKKRDHTNLNHLQCYCFSFPMSCLIVLLFYFFIRAFHYLCMRSDTLFESQLTISEMQFSGLIKVCYWELLVKPLMTVSKTCTCEPVIAGFIQEFHHLLTQMSMAEELLSRTFIFPLWLGQRQSTWLDIYLHFG